MILTTANNVNFTIDDEDYEKLKSYRWVAELHCRSRKPYIIRIDKHSSPARKYLHREVLGLPSGKYFQVDHINGDPSDNRKSNLRICEYGAQNAINRPKQKNNTSGFKGVFLRSPGVYRAAIRVNQKLLHLGQFKTAEEAAICYNEAATKYFGEFAYLNVITDKESP
jgi:hypothetical protein